MNLKVIYHNFRIGQVAIYGILTLVNFVVITFSLTDIKDQIPLFLYVPIILSLVVIASIFTGKHFKKIQLKTDSNEIFRHSPELIKTLRLVLEGQDKTVEREKWINKLKDYE